MLATSGDGTLSAYDLRKQKLWGRSDEQEDELLSVQIIKHGRKVVCGSQNGVLVVWTWGIWGDCSDRFPGHPLSVDAMLKVDESTVLTGSSDGFIRVVAVQPDRFLGLLGDHDGFPIESLRWSRDRAWIGSVTHDETVRFWDASVLKEEDGDEDAEDDEAEGATAAGELAEGGLAAPAVDRARGCGAKSDGADADSSDSDPGSDDGSDDDGAAADGGMDVDSDDSDSSGCVGGGAGGG
ncbi:unnamed protein product, partial [Phaeothamnion confervicola]